MSDRKGNVDIPVEQAALAEKVYKNGKPVVTIGFGSPYLVEHFPQAETWLAAFGISDVAQISVARRFVRTDSCARALACDCARRGHEGGIWD